MITGMVTALILHFLLYGTLCRHVRLFQTERGIFLFHAIPAAIGGAVVALWLLHQPDRETVSGTVLLLSMQGIYSLSFLEAWSLTQGGYSIRILDEIETARETGREPRLASLENFGSEKTVLRLAGLQRLGLIRQHGAGWELSLLGRLAAAGLGGIVRLVNPKSVG